MAPSGRSKMTPRSSRRRALACIAALALRANRCAGFSGPFAVGSWIEPRPVVAAAEGAARFRQRCLMSTPSGSSRRREGDRLSELRSLEERANRSWASRSRWRPGLWMQPRLSLLTVACSSVSSGGTSSIDDSVETISSIRANAPSGEPTGGEPAPAQRGVRWGYDLAQDFRRRWPSYRSDWADGFHRKSLPAIMFLYFACLLPAVAFGGIAVQVTGGTIGVIEYIMACGVSGMTYAALSGQPMTFVGPTGLTLAFISALYSFTSSAGLPFLPLYSWCGVWTSGMMVTMALAGTSNLIRFATQFTDDVFNALLAVNFIYEASRALLRNFQIPNANKTSAFTALTIALSTYDITRKTTQARDSRYFTRVVREFLSDFGPVMVILAMVLLTSSPLMGWVEGIEFLKVPTRVMLCNGRTWLSPMLRVPVWMRFAAAIPAMLLTSLFFLDQNISSRVVNSPKHKMVKGEAYHQDLLVLGLITGALSVVGLPWQCAATVQSLNHVRAMSETQMVTRLNGSKEEEITSVTENRVTGFTIHALILASLLLLPVLRRIPMPVVSGIFLYLGRKVMSGNGFLGRIKDLAADQHLLPEDASTRLVGYATALRYTLVQVAMLTLLWTLKSFKQTALFFPSVIGLLILVRSLVLPRFFSPKELNALDAPS